MQGPMESKSTTLVQAERLLLPAEDASVQKKKRTSWGEEELQGTGRVEWDWMGDEEGFR